MGSLSGRVAFVTGGGTGIGRAAAELFAAEGADVVVAGRRPEPLREVAAASDGRISDFTMDVTRSADRALAVAAVAERYGRLDILVNNAAVVYVAPFMQLKEHEIEHVFHANLTSTALFIQQCVPLLARTKGNIVNISSAVARYTTVPSSQQVAYSASKAGLNQLTRALAAELGEMGIRVNAVAPGATLTPMATSGGLDEPSMRKKVLEMTALGRVGEPIDVARSILFLASDQAEWVTGQILDASGGLWIAS